MNRKLVISSLLLFGLFTIAALFALGGTIHDFDELWHLATGRVIVETGRVPDRDPFTWTAGDAAWTNTNWLAQLVLYRVFTLGGIAGDWLLGVALFYTTLALLHARTRRASTWGRVPGVFFLPFPLVTGSLVRPQGWTFLLLAAALLLADRVRAGSKKALGALVLLLVLADQMHGGFVFIYVALGIEVVGELWDSKETRKRTLLLGGAVVAGLAGFALHPHGLSALVHPIRYASDPRVREIFIVQELLPPDPRTSDGFLVEVLVLGLLGLALVGRKAWRTAEVLSVLAFAHLAWQSARGIHYLAIVVAAPLATSVDGVLEAARERAPEPIRRLVRTLDELEPVTFVRGVPLCFVVAFVVAVAVWTPRLERGKPGDTSSPLLVTHSATAEIASWLETHPHGKIWNEMEVGGLLAWRCYPRRESFIDGRGDFHAMANTWHDFVLTQFVRPGWEEVLDRRGCDIAVIESGARLDQALAERGWPVVFFAPTRDHPREGKVIRVRPR